MSSPSLQMGGTAWRAAQAAGWLGAALRHAPGDDVLSALRETGEPPGGWWEWLRVLRSEPHSVQLALPRPGDARGVPVPRDRDVDAAVGCMTARGGTWLLPGPGGAWTTLSAESRSARRPDLREADRDLRRAVVTAAHALDESGPNPFGAGMPSVVDHTVDAWLASGVPMDTAARALAARGLRLLLAAEVCRVDPAHVAVTVGEDSRMRSAVASVEPAARAAVEAAYSQDETQG